MDRARGNVAPHLERRRVSCIRPRGGKSLRAVGYELPLLPGERAALIPDVPQEQNAGSLIFAVTLSGQGDQVQLEGI